MVMCTVGRLSRSWIYGSRGGFTSNEVDYGGRGGGTVGMEVLGSVGAKRQHFG